MEFIVILLVVLAGLYIAFGRKKAEADPVAPYKIEVAEPTPVAEQASQAVVESIAPAKKPRAPRKPKAESVKKPAVKKTAPKAVAKPASKPRAPRKPKAK